MDKYEYLDDLFEQCPTRGKMSAGSDTQVNHHMATLKRHEEKLNRYRNEGVL